MGDSPRAYLSTHHPQNVALVESARRHAASSSAPGTTDATAPADWSMPFTGVAPHINESLPSARRRSAVGDEDKIAAFLQTHTAEEVHVVAHRQERKRPRHFPSLELEKKQFAARGDGGGRGLGGGRGRGGGGSLGCTTTNAAAAGGASAAHLTVHATPGAHGPSSAAAISLPSPPSTAAGPVASATRAFFARPPLLPGLRPVLVAPPPLSPREIGDGVPGAATGPAVAAPPSGVAIAPSSSSSSSTNAADAPQNLGSAARRELDDEGDARLRAIAQRAVGLAASLLRDATRRNRLRMVTAVLTAAAADGGDLLCNLPCVES